ncbi:DegV family protein [Oenococcus oeni]|uniref:DegV family protein n=1 Tax=Oenococcus oeni TaxID=1247 RepID=UPI00050DEC9B|nr:DegV family protein [Oenococcus oeni]KGH82565.1 hypothetical protein X415_02315 [Oenococcus oeni S14]KGH97715.1 hypothetical protein X301_00670 [Oenococcus oeni IOEB_S450]KZD14115.1 hypothetical protein DUF194 [Oenococcus oeni]
MIKIVTDSTAQLTEDELKEYKITVVPLQISLRKQILLDGVDISRSEFSRELKESKDFPRTSQPSIGQFKSVYDDLGKDGSTVISIHMSEVLSGTVNVAREANKLTSTDVTVVDSGFTDRSLAFLVIEAAKMAQQGKCKTEILDQLAVKKTTTHLFCFINSLDYFVKGGRASRAIGFFSSLIKLKLVLTMEGNKLKVVSKCRGQARFQQIINKMVDSVVNSRGTTQVGLSYVDSDEEVSRIANFLHEKRPDLKIVTRLTSPIIMSHVGPKGFALMYDA